MSLIFAKVTYVHNEKSGILSSLMYFEYHSRKENNLMIYLIGASHAGIVISAWVHPDEKKHHNFGETPPSFQNYKSKFNDDTAGFNASSIYIGHYSKWWGENLALLSDGGVLSISPGFKVLLESIDRTVKNHLFVFMAGEEHYHLGLSEHVQNIDFEIPWRVDLGLQTGKQIIPYDVIESQISVYLKKSFMNFVAIRRLLPNVLIYNVLCPPPIILSNQISIDNVLRSSNHNDFIRLKYYIVYSEILTKFTQKLGLLLVSPPSEAVGENGFLKPSYAKDSIHGNIHYGEAVISQIKLLSKD